MLLADDPSLRDIRIEPSHPMYPLSIYVGGNCLFVEIFLKINFSLPTALATGDSVCHVAMRTKVVSDGFSSNNSDALLRALRTAVQPTNDDDNDDDNDDNDDNNSNNNNDDDVQIHIKPTQFLLRGAVFFLEPHHTHRAARWLAASASADLAALRTENVPPLRVAATHWQLLSKFDVTLSVFNADDVDVVDALLDDEQMKVFCFVALVAVFFLVFW
jgi:hypothetical protein